MMQFAFLFALGLHDLSPQDCEPALNYIQTNCATPIPGTPFCDPGCGETYEVVDAICSEEQAASIAEFSYCRFEPCYTSGQQIENQCYAGADDPSCTAPCVQAAESAVGSCEGAPGDEENFGREVLDYCGNPKCRDAVNYVNSNGCIEEPTAPERLCNAACLTNIAEVRATCTAPNFVEAAGEFYGFCTTLSCSDDSSCPTGLKCACGPSRRLLFSTPPSSCYCALP